MRSVFIAASIAGEDDILYTLPSHGITGITRLWCAYKNDDQVILPVRCGFQPEQPALRDLTARAAAA
jgi:hypothetical protein